MGQANKQQMILMTSFMEQHSDLAKSYAAGGHNSKESQKFLWEKLTRTLNANGPPSKTTQQWKRIWTTRKYAVKKKLVQNQQSLRKTGGGPFMELPLDTNEEAIVQACGIQAAIEGIAGVCSYGCEEENQAVPSEAEIDFIMDNTTPSTSKQPPTKKKDKPKIEEAVLLARRQIELQEKFLSVQNETQNSLEAIKTALNNINETLKVLCEVIQRGKQQ